MNSKFSLYDADIDLLNDDVSIDLKHLYNAVRKSWRYEDRRTISHIGSSDFSDHIAEIKMNDNISPPKVGGYPHRMLKFGWGYYHYDADTLYLARIKYDEQNGFYVKGYKNHNTSNEIGIMTDIDIDKKTISDEEYIRDNIDDIHRIACRSWPEEEIANIESIERSEDKRVYVIKIENSIDSVDDLKGREIRDLNVELPTVPTKNSIRCLIENGWGVIGIKRNEIYLSEIQPYISSEKIYDFNTKREKINTYRPKPCEECGEKEYVGEFVDGYKKHQDREQEVPDFKLLCRECS
jgi:hypothetical protein